MKRFAMFAALAVLAACSTPPSASKPAAPSTAAASSAADARITRFEGCDGYMSHCPTYRIELSPTGHFRYEGLRDAAPMGVVEGDLGAQAWTRATAALGAAGWATLGESFPATSPPCMPDAPQARFTWKVSATQEKSVGWSLGCRNAVASRLLDDLRAAIPAPKAMAAAPDKSELALWESPCYFPSCLSYQMWLKPDGSYRLDKGANTSTGSLGPDAWARAKAALAAANFETMPTNLTVSALNKPGGAPCINDLPDVAFTLTSPEGTDRAVRWSTGCNVPAAHKLLDDLRAIYRYGELVKKPQ